MAEWFINDEINYLHRVITGAMTGSVSDNPIFRRLFQLGVISLLHRINCGLETLNNDLNNSVILEGVSIDFENYINEEYWTDNFLFSNEEAIYQAAGHDIKEYGFKTVINYMTDYLPNGVDGFNITQDMIDSFKSSMHQLCDRNRFSTKDILYSLFYGVHYMIHLLKEIREKVEHPKPKLCRNVWDDIYDLYTANKYCEKYFEWKEDNEDYTLKDLKKYQKQEIYILLNSGFFRFYKNITGEEVKNRRLFIDEDDLQVGSKISEDFHVECAKFEKFFEYKGGCIISLKYEKLGYYIYKHYKKFNDYDLDNIVNFDKIMDNIHQDMARLNSKLKPFLKSYEGDLVNSIYEDCVSILDNFKQHIKENYKDTFLQCFLSKILFDKKIRQEARTMLVGKYRNKYICYIVYTLRDFYIFKTESTQSDLIETLSMAFGNHPSIMSIERYFKAFKKEKESELYEWTRKNIDEIKKQQINPSTGDYDLFDSILKE